MPCYHISRISLGSMLGNLNSLAIFMGIFGTSVLGISWQFWSYLASFGISWQYFLYLESWHLLAIYFASCGSFDFWHFLAALISWHLLAYGNLDFLNLGISGQFISHLLAALIPGIFWHLSISGILWQFWFLESLHLLTILISWIFASLGNFAWPFVGIPNFKLALSPPH